MTFRFSAQAAMQVDSHPKTGLSQTNPNSSHILHLNIKGTRFDDARGRYSPIRGDSLLLFDPLSGSDICGRSSADEWRLTRASTVSRRFQVRCRPAAAR